MTRASLTEPMRFETADDVVTQLRGQGGRMTVSRRMVIEALFAATDPISAEELSRGLQLELTSVYRTLERLEELGVVHHMHFGHGAGLYALRRAHGTHEYLFCERCGNVTRIDAARLDEVRREILEELGFAARFDHFPMAGVCAACADAATQTA